MHWSKDILQAACPRLPPTIVLRCMVVPRQIHNPLQTHKLISTKNTNKKIQVIGKTCHHNKKNMHDRAITHQQQRQKKSIQNKTCSFKHQSIIKVHFNAANMVKNIGYFGMQSSIKIRHDIFQVVDTLFFNLH